MSKRYYRCRFKLLLQEISLWSWQLWIKGERNNCLERHYRNNFALFSELEWILRILVLFKKFIECR